MTKEEDIENTIEKKLGGDIENFLAPMKRNPKNSTSFLTSTYKQVVFFIRKQFIGSFVQHCDTEKACFANFTDGYKNRTYYPAKQWH